MKVVQQIVIFLLSIVVAWWSYHWLLDWSVSLPIPDRIMSYYKEIGGPDPVVEYLIHFLTWYLPYALVALLVSVAVFKWGHPIAVLAAYLIVLLYLRGINYGFYHWLSQFLLVIILVGGFIYYQWRKSHKKLRQQADANGTFA